MGHVVSPLAFRIGYSRYWNNVWSLLSAKHYAYINLQDIYLYKLFFFYFRRIFYETSVLSNVKVIRKNLCMFVILFANFLPSWTFRRNALRESKFTKLKYAFIPRHRFFRWLVFSKKFSKNKIRKYFRIKRKSKKIISLVLHRVRIVDKLWRKQERLYHCLMFVCGSIMSNIKEMQFKKNSIMLVTLSSLIFGSWKFLIKSAKILMKNNIHYGNVKYNAWRKRWLWTSYKEYIMNIRRLRRRNKKRKSSGHNRYVKGLQKRYKKKKGNFLQVFWKCVLLLETHLFGSGKLKLKVRNQRSRYSALVTKVPLMYLFKIRKVLYYLYDFFNKDSFSYFYKGCLTRSFFINMYVNPLFVFSQKKKRTLRYYRKQLKRLVQRKRFTWSRGITKDRMRVKAFGYSVNRVKWLKNKIARLSRSWRSYKKLKQEKYRNVERRRKRLETLYDIKKDVSKRIVRLQLKVMRVHLMLVYSSIKLTLKSVNMAVFTDIMSIMKSYFLSFCTGLVGRKKIYSVSFLHNVGYKNISKVLRRLFWYDYSREFTMRKLSKNKTIAGARWWYWVKQRRLKRINCKKRVHIRYRRVTDFGFSLKMLTDFFCKYVPVVVVERIEEELLEEQEKRPVIRSTRLSRELLLTIVNYRKKSVCLRFKRLYYLFTSRYKHIRMRIPNAYFKYFMKRRRRWLGLIWVVYLQSYFFNKIKGLFKRMVSAVVRVQNVTVVVLNMLYLHMTSNVLGVYVRLRFKKYYTIRDILKAFTWLLNLYMRKFQAYTGIIGYKLICSGRFTRVERASYLVKSYGKLGMSTVDKWLDYSLVTLTLKYSLCGIKIWLCRNKRIRLFGSIW